MIARLSIFALLAVFAGCTSEPARRAPSERGDAREATAAPETRNPPQAVRNYDNDGKLLPSDEYIIGLRLPRGTVHYREDGVQHVYRIQAPIDKVLTYFGPMLITGKVERRGKGAIYKRASVRGAEVNPTKIDVSILEVGNSLTRICVTELPPAPKHTPSTDYTKAAAQRSFRTLD
jgi:hypothetical protein